MEAPYPGHMTPEQKKKEKSYLSGKIPLSDLIGDGKAMTRVLELISLERARQDRRWGVQDHSALEWLSTIGEELGEAHGIVNASFEEGKAGLNRPRLEGELIQVAALIVAALESFERTMGPQEWR